MDSDEDEAWQAQLVSRFATVQPFLPVLTDVVRFEATAEGAPVLAALRTLPGLIGRKDGHPERDRHRPAGRLVAAAGAVRAAPGRRAGRLAGVRVLRAGAIPPSPAPSRRLRHQLLHVGRPPREAARWPDVGDDQTDGAAGVGAARSTASAALWIRFGNAASAAG